MSAIAGTVNLFTDEAITSRLHKTMAHRGPNGKGSFKDPFATLLHTRLNSEDQQPMLYHLGKEAFVITVSGKLYNPRQLIQELTALGHNLQGDSDAEILLHAYLQWKERCLEKLNGVFALAIWEQERKKLFLARDRIGVQPLFYLLQEEGFLFASEMKTILSYPGIRAELDREGAAEILLLGPGRIPGSGVFRNLKELEPGCYAIYEEGRLQLTRYWKLTDREHRDSFEETAEQVRYLLEDAVTRQMNGERSAGAMLSGGLDSGIVSTLCAGILKQQGSPLKTFSVDYAGNDRHFTPSKFQPNADPEFIRIMQQHLHTEHYWSVLTPEDLIRTLPDATIARDLPGMADIDSSLLAFCARIRPHAKVVFSGECADEIFGGYPWYRDETVRNSAGFPWAQTQRERTALLHPWITEQIDPHAFVQERYAQTIRDCDILPGTDPKEKRMKEMMNLNFRWFMQTLLDRNDRMSMHCGLEVRVPFCDYRIAEYLYGVPWDMKDHNGVEKGLLRYAFRDLIPQSILTRKKSPFPKTHDPKYLTIATELLGALLQDSSAPVFQLVRRKALEDLLKQETSWPWYGQLMRRPQTMMFMTQINYWLEHYSVSIV